MIKKKRQKKQIKKIRNEKGEVTTDNAEIQKIVRDHYEQLYGKEMDNLQEMDRILGEVQSSKTEPGRNRNYEQPNYKHWNWSCDQKSPKKQKPMTRWLHRRIQSNTYRRANAYPSSTLSKNWRGRNTSKFILRGHHYPDIKTRQRQHKERKIKANITNEHRCKNPQQNFSKQNSATHQKAHTPWPSWIYSRDARILQCMQINQCDTPY